MNNEPIHFLPIEKFWERPPVSAFRFPLSAFLAGCLAGTIGTVIVASVLIWLLR